jgi:2-methylcitrate dehydratase PrpD
MLQTAVGIVALAAKPASGDAASASGVQPRADSGGAPTDLTGRVARYMADARDRELPANVLREAKHRTLDTIAAMVSGTRLKPGEMAIRYVRAQGGVPEASVLTTDLRTSAVNAALANGMFAHADETDDVEIVTKLHPGSAVVPAALAVGERETTPALMTARSGTRVTSPVALTSSRVPAIV